MLGKLSKFHYQTVFTSHVFNKRCFVFHAEAFDDVKMKRYLKS